MKRTYLAVRDFAAMKKCDWRTAAMASRSTASGRPTPSAASSRRPRAGPVFRRERARRVARVRPGDRAGAARDAASLAAVGVHFGTAAAAKLRLRAPTSDEPELRYGLGR